MSKEIKVILDKDLSMLFGELTTLNGKSESELVTEFLQLMKPTIKDMVSKIDQLKR